MKKLFAVLMAVLFLGATTGLVNAQGTAGSTGKTVKEHKGGKKGHKGGKKGKKGAIESPSSAPATAAAPK